MIFHHTSLHGKKTFIFKDKIYKNQIIYNISIQYV